MTTIYDTPKANLENEQAPAFSLFKLNGIVIATFVGSAVAGGILMYINFKRLGLPDKANKSLLYSIIGFVLLMIASIFIPYADKIPNIAFTVAQVVALLHFSKEHLGPLIDSHAANGGELASNWKAFGIGLLVLLPVVAFVFLLAFSTI
ncbi:hypothetical protein [Halioxenophilus aromaticivorans]|uniref:Uncharacterized protein n=1 Tax=Halioxenophilus aromaticivorans TaxID=1306992 RepID=A0AAV3U325_9ALTE